jgi:hypothetical protein
MVLAVYIGFGFFYIFLHGSRISENKKNPNHDSRRLKFDIFERFTNNGELIREKM